MLALPLQIAIYRIPFHLCSNTMLKLSFGDQFNCRERGALSSKTSTGLKKTLGITESTV